MHWPRQLAKKVPNNKAVCIDERKFHFTVRTKLSKTTCTDDADSDPRGPKFCKDGDGDACEVCTLAHGPPDQRAHGPMVRTQTAMGP